MLRGHDLVKFRWRDGFRLLSDAQACGERLQELKALLGRDPQAPDLVNDATRSKNSPFRKDIFQKTDAEAALEHRLDVARTMLRACVMIKINTVRQKGKRPVVRVREMYYLQHVPKFGYMTTEEVVNDDELRTLALEEIYRGLKAWKLKVSRFESLSEKFDDILNEAEKLLKKARSRKNSVKKKSVKKKSEKKKP